MAEVRVLAKKNREKKGVDLPKDQIIMKSSKNGYSHGVLE